MIYVSGFLWEGMVQRQRVNHLFFLGKYHMCSLTAKNNHRCVNHECANRGLCSALLLGPWMIWAEGELLLFSKNFQVHFLDY